MKLTLEQQKRFEDDGYLIMPDLFSSEEIAVLKNQACDVFAYRSLVLYFHVYLP